MLRKNEIVPLIKFRSFIEAPIVPMDSMVAANDVAEKFFETDTPTGILLVRGPLGVGKTRFLMSHVEIFNSRNSNVYVAKILPTAAHLKVDYSEYRGKVLVFIVAVVALARRPEQTIALWKKLLDLGIAIVAEVFEETDIKAVCDSFGHRLAIANIGQPSKRDLSLFALNYYALRVPQGRPHLDAEFFRDLIGRENSFRSIMVVILREKIAFEKRIKLHRDY